MNDYTELSKAIEDLGRCVKEIERIARSLCPCQTVSQAEIEDATTQEVESTEDVPTSQEANATLMAGLDNDSLLEAYKNGALFEELQDLAHKAGGKLSYYDPAGNDIPAIIYIRCSKLKITTLSCHLGIIPTPYNYPSWKGQYGENRIFRNRYRLFARIPYDYKLLRKILEKDADLYAALPDRG